MIEVQNTPIEGVKLILPAVFSDDRGSFSMVYHRDHYVENGIAAGFVQDNEAVSRLGVLRGLHYQVDPFGQGKLVRVTRGSVYDVAVDLRPESKTYGQWYGVELSAANRLQLFIPPQFAHGYIAMEDNTVFNYKCSELYSPAHEGGIIWNDPRLAIEWPDPGIPLTISEKDMQLPAFGDHRPV